MVKIQDAEWTTVVQMWWAFVWRVMLIGMLIGLVIGFIFGFLGAILGNAVMGQMMGMGFSMLFNLPVSIWAYRAASPSAKTGRSMSILPAPSSLAYWVGSTPAHAGRAVVVISTMPISWS
jgi:ABC-type antimicrobial peptide transport system permease subunit